MQIEIAKFDHAKHLSELVKLAADELRLVDFNEEGWNIFLQSTTQENIEKIISSPEYWVICCFEQEEIIGFITLQNLSKIVHLFVHPMARNRGLASRLWEFAQGQALANGATGDFWVRSSSLAIPLYTKFGFIAEGERQVFHGIRFQLMRLQHCSIRH